MTGALVVQGRGMDRERFEQVRVHACLRKRRYDRRFPAVKTAERLTKQSRVLCRAYHCPFCGGYHVGRPPSLARMRLIAEAIRHIRVFAS